MKQQKEKRKKENTRVDMKNEGWRDLTNSRGWGLREFK